MSIEETNQKIQVWGVPLQGLNLATVMVVGFLAKGSLETQETNQNQLQQTTIEMRDDLRALKADIHSLQRKADEAEKIAADVERLKNEQTALREKLDRAVQCILDRRRCTL